MQLLLRKVTQDADGHNEYLDISLDGGILSIGSSPRCDIQLLGTSIAAQHARLQQEEDGKTYLVAEKNKHFIARDKPQKKLRLTPGDDFSIDAQHFRCVAAPAGFDLALEWDFCPVARHLLENAYRTSLDDLKFSTRKVSWLLVLLVFVLAGLMPVADNMWRRWSVSGENSGSSPIAAPSTGANVDREMTIDHHVLGLATLRRPAADQFWLSGPLLPGHQIAMGERCEACHRQPFQQVQDAACESCHGNVDAHLNARHPATGDFTEFSCQSCHKEHHEQQQIVSHSDRLCVQCHGDSEAESRVTTFSSDGHPEFMATMLVPRQSSDSVFADTRWQSHKSILHSGLQEQNHLVYPHDVHLDPKAVTHLQRGDGLLCADCHQLQADGEHFAPVTMEQHCADCHDLSFDRDNPQKQLPHGEPVEVYEVLKNYFVELAFNPRDDGFERRRLPGKVTIDESCDQDYDCAIAQTQRQAQQQFLQSGCVTCHQVSERDNAEGSDRWRVLPVKLNKDWYSSSQFDHRSHLTPNNAQHDFTGEHLTNNNNNNNAVCLSCHQADQSSSSADVLLPSRAQCTNCHGDGSDAGFLLKPRVALNCIACHDYHSANQYFARGSNNESQ